MEFYSILKSSSPAPHRGKCGTVWHLCLCALVCDGSKGSLFQPAARNRSLAVSKNEVLGGLKFWLRMPLAALNVLSFCVYAIVLIPEYLHVKIDRITQEGEVRDKRRYLSRI